MEPRTFTYTPASAHRAALALVKRMLPPIAILCIAVTIFTWQRTAHKPLFIRLLDLPSPPLTGVAVGFAAFFVVRQMFSSTSYTCTPDSLTFANKTRSYAIDRTKTTRLVVTPSYLTLHASKGHPVRIRKELDDYPELLQMLKTWPPPEVLYRKTDLRSLAIAWIPPILGIALYYYLFK